MEKRWPRVATYSEVVRFAARNGQEEWVGEHFRRLIDSNPRKGYWDIILQWAVLCRGEGVEGVRHMLDIMAQNNTESESILPDIDSINGLVRIAIEKNDQYLAERFMALASELGIRPNPTTYRSYTPPTTRRRPHRSNRPATHVSTRRNHDTQSRHNPPIHHPAPPPRSRPSIRPQYLRTLNLTPRRPRPLRRRT